MSKYSEKLNVEISDKNDVLDKTPNEASKILIRKIEKDGFETSFDRFEQQKPQCSFGLTGTCCRMCQWGPCKISEHISRGVCGRNREEIVISNIIRSLVAGLSAHACHAHEILYTLKGITKGAIAMDLKGLDQVIDIAERLKLTVDNKKYEDIASEVADILIEDLSRMNNEPIRLLYAYAPRERINTWERLNLIPRSSAYEVMESLHITTLGGSSDWTAIAEQEKRAALAYCYSSLFASSLATEILFDIPKVTETEINYGVLKKDYVNILMHGHSPIMVEKVIEKIRLPEIEELARSYGARGIVIGGLCCTGTELLARHGIPTITNILGQELVIGTGAVDCVIVDMQCVIPGLKILADCYQTKIITTNKSNRIPGALHLAFDPEKPEMLDQNAMEIARISIEAYKNRDRSKIHIPHVKVKALAGYSYESVLNSFGDIHKIVTLLKEGKIQGIVTIVGCNNPKVVYEYNHVTIARKMIESDIIVLTSGCSSYALLNAGLCHTDAVHLCGQGLQQIISEYKVPPVMPVGGCVDNTRTLRLFIDIAASAGVDIKDMPYMFIGPEPGNEKSIGQGLTFLLHGISNLVGFPAQIPVPVLRSKNKDSDDELERESNPIIDYFGGDGAINDFGAKIFTEPDPYLAAQLIRMHIRRKRLALDWV